MAVLDRPKDGKIKKLGVPHPISLDSKYWTNRRFLDPGNAAEVVPVDINDGVDKEIIDIFVTSRRQEIGVERRGRGDNVRTWEACRNAQGTRDSGENRVQCSIFPVAGVFLMPSDMGNRWHEQLSAYCVGGEVWKCADYVEVLFSPDFMVPTDEQGQHGERSDRQQKAVEPVHAMILVGRHVDMPQEHVERDMEARVVLSPWSEHKMWGGAEVEFIPAQERLCRMQKLRSSRATRGVALAHDQESGLGAQDEEELHVQQIKSRNVSILVTDMGKEASPCGTGQVGPDNYEGMGNGTQTICITGIRLEGVGITAGDHKVLEVATVSETDQLVLVHPSWSWRKLACREWSRGCLQRACCICRKGPGQYGPQEKL